MLSNMKRGEKSPLFYFLKKRVILNNFIRIYGKKRKFGQNYHAFCAKNHYFDRVQKIF